MCLMVQDSNNLDTEDLIIFTNLLARFDDLATATEGFDRPVTRFDDYRW